jgi:hypothetical protein
VVKFKPVFAALGLAMCAANVFALPCSSPEAQGISSPAILDFVQSADKQVDAMHSFMLVRHGFVVAEGTWVVQHGSFMAAAAAGPVYTLLGKDLGTTNFPPMGTALVDGDIAFRQHSGGHTDAPNWPVFLEFASRYFKTVSAKLLK